MTVQNNYEIESYTANGVIKEFDFHFEVLNKTEIVVNIEDINKNIIQKVLNTDFIINLNSDNSGSIIFFIPPENNYKVYISRIVAINQQTQYKTSSGFQAEVVEKSFDKLTMINQQQQTELDKCVKISQFTTEVISANAETPIENKGLMWGKNINGEYYLKNTQDNPDTVYKDIIQNPNVIAVGTNINSVNIDANNINSINKVANNETNINTVAKNNNAISSVSEWINTSGGEINYYIGQIISVDATADYIPDGTLPCDGLEYTKAQFTKLWNNFLNASTPLLNTCTYEEYQQDITTYGQCGKFAIDTINEKFKTPTIKDGAYITQALSDSETGKIRTVDTSLSSTLDWNNKINILNNLVGGYTVPQNGYIVVNCKGNPIQKITLNGVSLGNIGSTNNYNEPSEFTIQVNTNDIISFSQVPIIAYFVPFISSESSIALRFFIVVANGSINQSQMDWSAWASSLAGKANVDLSNVDLSNLSINPVFVSIFSLTKGLVQQMPFNGYIQYFSDNTPFSNIPYYIVIDICDSRGNFIEQIAHYNRISNLGEKVKFWSPLLKKGTYFKVVDIFNPQVFTFHNIFKSFN